MFDDHQKLTNYAYNILGSYEDARDVVQDVYETYLKLDKSGIDNETGYLVRSVVNSAINAKKRLKRLSGDAHWLPEPVSSDRADQELLGRETATYSMLVLMERLSPHERAVFVLKEAFDYSHENIAAVLDTTVENSRKLLSRARAKLKADTNAAHMPDPDLMHSYVEALVSGDTAKLESLFSDASTITADGGRKKQVYRRFVSGIASAVDLVTHVFRNYQSKMTHRICEINGLPALVFYENGIVANCQIFDWDGSTIRNIYSVVDPDKLKNIH